ncbi:MAG: M20/M25/M40 family metallo-hydrolase [Candidatus Aminicenantes bacterium]|nr:M20/M25/M40 family metallo-hydrolase [Candidatus Aminicenantes bacterium]
MDVIQLTRRLIDIPSVTGGEGAVADFTADWLKAEGFRVVRQEVEPGRANVFASAGAPVEVVLCSHLDTVPDPFPSGEDDAEVRGRGACDAKGSVAAMMAAGRALRAEGFQRFGLLFVVGEETDSRGAKAAASLNPGSRFIVIGEPTGNKMALGHKGVLSLLLKTKGRAAHSAFPHLGESAIDRLLDILQEIRAIEWEEDPVLGSSTINIGRIEGGTAANVIAAEAAASVMIRFAISSRAVLTRVYQTVAGRASYEILSENSPVYFGLRPGYETAILPFGSDAPYLEGFGERFMLGPGEPEDAHTEGEKVAKQSLEDAVALYRKLVRELAEEPVGKAAGR